jgi:hypothetical protein
MKNIDLMIMLVLILVILYFYKLDSCPQNYYLVNGNCKSCVGGTVVADGTLCLCPTGASLNADGTACIPDFL